VSGTDVLAFLAVFLGAGGGGVALLGAIKDWRSERRSAPSRTDANVLTVGLARDQLAKDNDGLRQERAEEAARHAAERAEWTRERAALKAEHAIEMAELNARIDVLEAKVRSLLDEVLSLKSRPREQQEGRRS
jgi:hypothetical protein